MDTAELEFYFERYLEDSRRSYPNVSLIDFSIDNVVENFDEVFTAITIMGSVSNEWLCETTLLLGERYPGKTICWNYNLENQVVIELYDAPTNPGEVYDTASVSTSQG